MPKSDVIDYVTMSTAGNATDFGNLTVARSVPAAASNGTRATFGGGHNSSINNDDTIDYVTIDTAGNATDFGNLSVGRSGGGGLSGT